MVELRRTYRFCASHRLHRREWSDEENFRVFGPTSLPGGHGHNFRLTVVMAGEPDPVTERVLDVDALDRAVESAVLVPFDHRNLNADVAELRDRVPTGEVLIQEIWRRLQPAVPGGRLVEIVLQLDEFLSFVVRC